MTLGLLTKKIGVSMTTGSQWINNIKQPTRKHTKLLCEILDVTPAELYGGISQEEFLKEKEFSRRVIITGTVQAAGKIRNRKEKIVNLPKELSTKKSKAVICVGDSMKGICNHGDLILYNESLKVRNNDLVIVNIQGYGLFFKKFRDLMSKDHANLTKKMIKKLQKKEHIYEFSSVNQAKKYLPLLCGSNEIIYVYKVTGICYR